MNKSKPFNSVIGCQHPQAMKLLLLEILIQQKKKKKLDKSYATL